jgi:single-strand DNA-binding protein
MADSRPPLFFFPFISPFTLRSSGHARCILTGLAPGILRAEQEKKMSKGNVNKVILVGHIGADPELRFTAKGNPVATLSLATNRDFKNAEGATVSETHWHRATVWGKRAEFCAKYLVKGSRVFLEGELQMKSWTDKEGITRKSAEILVDNVQFMGGTRREMAGAPAGVSEISAYAQ